MNSGKNTLVRIALQYALSRIDEAEITTLLSEVLSREEKAQVLMQLSEERIRHLLLTLGFKPEFLNTL